MKLKKVLIVDGIVILIGLICILIFYLFTHPISKKHDEIPLLLNNAEIKEDKLIVNEQYILSFLNNEAIDKVSLSFKTNTELYRFDVNSYYTYKIDGKNIYFLPTISIKDIFLKNSLDRNYYKDTLNYLVFSIQNKNSITQFEFNVLSSSINF